METLRRTTFKNLDTGTRVNLERSMSVDSRFGGHIVQGHVDAVGSIRRFDCKGNDWIPEVDYDSTATGHIVSKGSIAIDGISLTISDLGTSSFSIAIIPYTMQQTNLQYCQPGDTVNLEFDIIAKYVENLVNPYLKPL